MQDFRDTGVELKLNRPTSFPSELTCLLRRGFREIYRSGTPYRSTGVILSGLVPVSSVQYTLFDDVTGIEKMSRIYSAVDKLSYRFGKHTVQHASSLPAKVQAQHEGERGDVPVRKGELFKGENKRQKIGIPVLNVKV